MYKNVLLTPSELLLLKKIIEQYSMDCPEDEERNVCILFGSLLRALNNQKENETIN